MSGGHFDYNQHWINDIIDSIQYEIDNNNVNPNPDWISQEEWENVYHSQNYSKNTIDQFKKGIYYLKMAYIYAHRIDYLLEGDDGEETFRSRLIEDIVKEFGENSL